MKKVVILIIIIYNSFLFISCNKENITSTNITSVKNTTNTLVEDEIIKDSTIDGMNNTYEEYLFDSNVFYVCDHYSFFDYALAESGKIILYYDFVKLLNEQDDNSQVLYAAILVEDNGVGIYELYESYLKNSEILSEFSNRSEEEIDALLNTRANIEKENSVKWDGNIKSEVIIYATKEQLLALNNSDCSDNLALYIRSFEWPLVELSKEDIQKYNGEKIPVYYYINEDGYGRCTDEWVTKEDALTLLENKNVYNIYWSYEIIHNNPDWKQKK